MQREPVPDLAGAGLQLLRTQVALTPELMPAIRCIFSAARNDRLSLSPSLVVPATLEGHQGLAVFTSRADRYVRNFIELTMRGEQIARIRDFHHVPYFTSEARIECAQA